MCLTYCVTCTSNGHVVCIYRVQYDQLVMIYFFSVPTYRFRKFPKILYSVFAFLLPVPANGDRDRVVGIDRI